MKKLLCILLLFLSIGCQQKNSISKNEITVEQTNCKTFHIYHEFSDIFDAIEISYENDKDIYLENVEVDYIDREQNRLLVILKNDDDKKFSAWIQLKEIPAHIQQNISVKISSLIEDSFPPILDSIKIYETSNDGQYTYYDEYSNVFEGAIAECSDQDKYYFEKVEIIDFDRKNNRAFVTLRNPQNKKCSAFISLKELPQNVPRYANITVTSFVKESFPPTLSGIKIEPYTEK